MKLFPEFAKIGDEVYANHVMGSDVEKCVCGPGVKLVHVASEQTLSAVAEQNVLCFYPQAC